VPCTLDRYVEGSNEGFGHRFKCSRSRHCQPVRWVELGATNGTRPTFDRPIHSARAEDGRRHDPWQQRSIQFPRHIQRRRKQLHSFEVDRTANLHTHGLHEFCRDDTGPTLDKILLSWSAFSVGFFSSLPPCRLHSPVNESKSTSNPNPSLESP
jgi:hypothetical protein